MISPRTATSLTRSLPLTSRTFVGSTCRAIRPRPVLVGIKDGSRGLSGTAVRREPPVDNPSHASVDHESAFIPLYFK